MSREHGLDPGIGRKPVPLPSDCNSTHITLTQRDACATSCTIDPQGCPGGLQDLGGGARLAVTLIGYHDFVRCRHGDAQSCAWAAVGVLPVGRAARVIKGGRDLAVVGRAEHDIDRAEELCRANSFTGETKVLLANGKQKPISKVRVGDKVLATDPATGNTGARRVEKVIVHRGRHTLVELAFADGSALSATNHHPFWDASTGRFAYRSRPEARRPRPGTRTAIS